eukprot:10492650-Alexandrium_andersonii.AAC.1
MSRQKVPLRYSHALCTHSGNHAVSASSDLTRAYRDRVGSRDKGKTVRGIEKVRGACAFACEGIHV